MGDWLLAVSKPPAGGGQQLSGGGQHCSGGAVARTLCLCQLGLTDDCHICKDQVRRSGVPSQPDSLPGHEAAEC